MKTIVLFAVFLVACTSPTPEQEKLCKTYTIVEQNTSGYTITIAEPFDKDDAVCIASDLQKDQKDKLSYLFYESRKIYEKDDSVKHFRYDVIYGEELFDGKTEKPDRFGNKYYLLTGE